MKALMFFSKSATSLDSRYLPSTPNWVTASSTPFHAVALKDLSSIPPVSVTWQTRNLGAAVAASVGAAVGASVVAAVVGASVGAGVALAQAPRTIAATR